MAMTEEEKREEGPRREDDEDEDDQDEENLPLCREDRDEDYLQLYLRVERERPYANSGRSPLQILARMFSFLARDPYNNYDRYPF